MSLCDVLGLDPIPEPIEDEEIKQDKLTPFDFVNAISFSKENLFSMGDYVEKSYNAYIVNRALSFSADTVLFANEMNIHHRIPVSSQFDFLSKSIRKKKRYDKWVKGEKESDEILLIKQYYNYSNEKAKQVLPLLSQDHLDFIKAKLNTGGVTTKKRK